MVQTYDLHTHPILQKETFLPPQKEVYDLHFCPKGDVDHKLPRLMV